MYWTRAYHKHYLFTVIRKSVVEAMTKGFNALMYYSISERLGDLARLSINPPK